MTDLDAGHGYKTLVVEGRHAAPDANPPYAAPGKWYWIGEQTVELDACQTGEWDAAADQDSSGNFTEFTLPIEAYISDFQVGWLLQPDVNVAVYLPITSISGHTLTVSGSYGSLVASSSGTHFRIHAPPGIERTGPFFSGFEAGTLSRFTSASSSRNLFGGYRYESPLAGVRDDLWMAVQGRQSGWNFTGLYYTLHRHYDPNLMRFTSIDPAAAPFFNLYSYCGGNPASGYDPDGLWMERNAGEMGGGGFGFGGFEVGSMTDLLNAGGAAFSMINEAQNQVASSLYGNPFETFRDRWDGTWEYGLEPIRETLKSRPEF